MSARKIIPKPGRVCLAIDGTRIPPDGIDVDLSTPQLATWATRLVDVHQDATFDAPPPPVEALTPDVVFEAPAAAPTVDVVVDAPSAEALAPVAEPVVEVEPKPERARSRKGAE